MTISYKVLLLNIPLFSPSSGFEKIVMFRNLLDKALRATFGADSDAEREPARAAVNSKE